MPGTGKMKKSAPPSWPNRFCLLGRPAPEAGGRPLSASRAVSLRLKVSPASGKFLKNFPDPSRSAPPSRGRAGTRFCASGESGCAQAPRSTKPSPSGGKPRRKTVRQSRPSRKRKRRPPSQRPGYRLPPEGTEKIPAETKKAAARPERMPYPATLAALLRWKKN